MTAARRSLLSGLLMAAAGALACDPPPPFALRVPSGEFVFLISAEPLPPRSREPVQYKVLVRDIKSGEPIEGGEGRIFATSKEGAQVYDGFVPGQEAGSYYGKLRFVTSGDWAMALQFRRDSTKPLTRADWQQSVLASKDRY